MSQLFWTATSQTLVGKQKIDRNCVAHRREPTKLGKPDGATLDEYVLAVRELVSAYLNSLPPGKWPEVMYLKLENGMPQNQLNLKGYLVTSADQALGEGGDSLKYRCVILWTSKKQNAAF